ncbi:GNAT family N-acetyltransferase [Gracilibacillus caseinilyticus]|uniref:GNAT family N-acetyltransferase n=1 Tax=Gracilibacillus caseinilyticus TaxID=2932256 RepID=A0ABY4ERY0_9BACI|nr:GNAT family N-acetyltransferase [Gracilibacillus caseinilyticus]UOQ46638.1 GNAT family N-acetyltransferase [Gracilibacillus caseinilyticus]
MVTILSNQHPFIIRSAQESDAKELVQVRLQMDGETENMDREKGEAYLDEAAFRQLIRDDRKYESHLFLVAEMNGNIAGFSRCEGNELKRLAHKVEFGVGVLREYWGYGIGRQLLEESIQWAWAHADIKKMQLSVLETNDRAIALYKKLGFEVEGQLKQDKLLSDGKYYDTILM